MSVLPILKISEVVSRAISNSQQGIGRRLSGVLQ